MFYEHSISRFRYFQLFCDLQQVGQRQRPYVFYENSGDIATIDLIPYENHVEPNATGQLVKFAGLQEGLPKYETLYFNVIIEILKLSTLLYGADLIDAFGQVMVGENDIFVMGVVGFSQMNTFLPSGIDTTSIWVKNLEYRSSQFYFLDTFSTQLWIFYLVAFVLCILLCLCFKKCVDRTLSKSHYTSIDTFTFISLLFEQGDDTPTRVSVANPRQCTVISLKIILITYLGLLIIFYGSFGAFLSALLAVQHISLPFNNLDELLQQDGYIICTWKPSNLEPLLESYPRGMYNISAEINNPQHCPGSHTNLYQHSGSNYSCDYEKLTFLNNPCTISGIKSQCGLTTPLKGKYFQRYTSGFVYSGFPYKQQFNLIILKIASSGIANLFANRLLPTSNDESSIGSTLVSIDFNQISLILAIFIGGILCSIFVLLGEMWYAQRASPGKPGDRVFIRQ